jgi:hypothetical protein
MTDQENTPNEAEVSAELAKPEDVTAYVEERHEQEAQDTPPADDVDAIAREHPEFKEAKKASRYERLKRARDQYKAEAEDLRQRYEGGSEASPVNHARDTGEGPKLEHSMESARKTYGDVFDKAQRALVDTLATDKETYLRVMNAADPGEALIKWHQENQASMPETARLESSLESAIHMHGDAFQRAYDAFVEYAHRTRDQETYQRVMNSADPGAELVAWHNEQGNPSPSPESVEAAMQQGRQDQEFQQQLAARDDEIRVQTEARLRSEAFAAQCSDYHETLQSIEGLDEGVSPLMIDLVRRSNVGPEIAYLMARDFWDPESKGILDHAKDIANDPIAQARMVGALEQVVYASRKMNGGMAPAARTTKAPPPLSQVRGGANAPRDLHSLAKSESADDYIRARRSAS